MIFESAVTYSCGMGVEHGPLMLRWSRNQDGTYNIFNVPIFQIHTRKGERFDTDRLDLIVENSRKRRRAANAKVFVAHNGFMAEGSKTLTVGDLRNLERHVGVITADFLNLRPAVFREIWKRGYVQRSVELDPEDLNAIEGIALLGKEQPYFPFRDIGLEVSDAEAVVLDADVDSDVSFQWSRGRKREHALYALGETMMPQYFIKKNGKLVKFDKPALYDEDGNKVSYEINPEDMDALDARIEEKLAPAVEAVGILSSEVKGLKESMQQKDEEANEEQFDRQPGDVAGGDTEGTEEGVEEEVADDVEEDEEEASEDLDEEDAGDEESEDDDMEDESEEELDDESMDDEEDDEDLDDEDSEEEDEEDDVPNDKKGKKGKKGKPSKDAKKILNQSSREAAKAAKSLAQEAYERHALESVHSDEDLEAEIREFIDPAHYANVDDTVAKYVKQAKEFEPAARKVFIDGLREAYASNRPPSKKLPRKTKKTSPDGSRVEGEHGEIAERAESYFKRRESAKLPPWHNLSKEDFVKFARDNPDTFEELVAGLE